MSVHTFLLRMPYRAVPLVSAHRSSHLRKRPVTFPASPSRLRGRTGARLAIHFSAVHSGQRGVILYGQTLGAEGGVCAALEASGQGRRGRVARRRTFRTGAVCVLLLLGAAASAAPVELDLDAETKVQFDELIRQIGNRKWFARVASQASREAALILPADRDPADVVLRRTAALLARLKDLPGCPDLADAGKQLADRYVRATPLPRTQFAWHKTPFLVPQTRMQGSHNVHNIGFRRLFWRPARSRSP